MFDNRRSGSIAKLGNNPACGFEIDEVVIAEFFAL
jgi:hypothetical protein